jgi:hypothetical protein
LSPPQAGKIGVFLFSWGGGAKKVEKTVTAESSHFLDKTNWKKCFFLLLFYFFFFFTAEFSQFLDKKFWKKNIFFSKKILFKKKKCDQKVTQFCSENSVFFF